MSATLFAENGSAQPVGTFPGARAPFTLKSKIFQPQEQIPVPIYRVMNREGEIQDASQDPKLEKEVVQKMLRSMVLLNTMDKILYESQR